MTSSLTDSRSGSANFWLVLQRKDMDRLPNIIIAASPCQGAKRRNAPVAESEKGPEEISSSSCRTALKADKS
jgi:hypothetical protein